MVYVGGGSVYRIPQGEPGAGNLLMLTQPAMATYKNRHVYPDCNGKGTNCNKDEFQDWNYLGLAQSTDDGLTWQDLGLAVSANQPYLENDPSHPKTDYYDDGNGSLVVQDMPDGKFFVIYFRDRLQKPNASGYLTTAMSVARVPYEAFLQWAASNTSVPEPTASSSSKQKPKLPLIAKGGSVTTTTPTMPSFEKYFNSSWSQPGIGGLSTDILLYQPQYNMAITHNNSINKWVGFFGYNNQLHYAESYNGITDWSAYSLIPTPNITDNQTAVYFTPVGTGADPSVIGNTFYLFYTVWNNSNTNTTTMVNPAQGGGGATTTCAASDQGWCGGVMRRMEITCGN